jgi:uncharacterized protein (DUF433 family)
MVHYLKREELLKRITINPLIMMGKPTIRGSRLTVEHILKALAAGLVFKQLKEEYSFLEEDDIEASMLYDDIQLFKNLRLEPYFCEKNQIYVISKPEDMYKDKTQNWVIIGRPGVDGIEFMIRNNFDINRTIYVYFPIDDEHIEIADSPEELVRKWKDNSIRF